MNEFINELKKLLKNKFFYFGLFIYLTGMFLNFLSQIYLYDYISYGNIKLPVLSDLILDNIPYFNVPFIYDYFAFFSVFVLVIYIIKEKQYKKIPYYLFMFGLFLSLRAVFIILTPFGNPPNFKGSDTFFNGFSKYQLGVYPSGHTGAVFLEFLFVKGAFRTILFIFLLIVIISLFLSRGHYSIDILSGALFAYALYSFGEKYLKNKLVLR